MTLKKLILLALFGLPFFGILAQDKTNYLKTDLIPPSPTAGSLGKFGEIPLNLSTGSVGLNIPIFELAGTDLNLPVSLSYSYDGFKPAQQISWVGLGWNLMAGGVITRIIHGKVDGTSNSGYNYEDATVQERLHNINIDNTFLKNITEGIYDAETDIYNFNFDGYSGKFIVYKGKFYCFPYQKLRITGSPDAGFTITTENGVKYEFAAFETSHAKGSSNTPYTLPDYKSSYYLTKISNPSNTEFITLDYDSDGQINNGGTFTQSYRISPPPTSYPSILYSPVSIFPTRVDALRLSHIKSEKYTITFIAGADREDIENGYNTTSKVLGEILVVNKRNRVLKNYKFFYSYLGGTGPSRKYLKMNSLFEMPVDQDNEGLSTPVLPDTSKIMKHFFDYNENGSFPSRSFPWVDHFGYYTGNGDFNGQVMIPNIFYPAGPNRNPQLAGTLLGSLKKITYPTGGSTSFSYEMNDDFAGYNFLNIYSSFSLALTRPANNWLGTLTTSNSFIINVGQTVNIVVYRKPKVAAYDNLSKNTLADVSIYGPNGKMFDCSVGFESDSVGKAFSTYLPAGAYSFDLICDAKERDMYATISYYQKSDVPAAGDISGGIRLSHTQTLPVFGEPVNKKYIYKSPNGFSSGAGPGLNYSSTAFKELHVKTGGITEEVNTTIINSSVSPNHLIGVPHYYTSVVEMEYSNNDSLMTRHDFQSFDHYFLGIVPIRETFYKHKGIGQFSPILKKEYLYYTKSDTSFRSIVTSQSKGFVEEGGWYDGTQVEYTNGVNIYEQACKYLIKSREVTYQETDSLVNEKSYQYDLDDTRSMLSTTTTASDGSVIKTKFKYPENYSFSLVSPFLSAHVISPVFEQQVWKTVGQDSVLISSELTTYNTTFFKPSKISVLEIPVLNQLNSEVKVNGRYTSLLSDTRYNDRVSFGYDGTYGRLINQKLTGGPSSSFQWGYFGNPFNSFSSGPGHIVAEAKNADPNEFLYEGFEDASSAVIGTGHTGNHYSNVPYTVNWIIPNSKGYAISYWYLSNGSWLYVRQPYTGTLTINSGTAVDDIAIYPNDAELTSYAYVQGLGPSASIDVKGMTTHFDYDYFNRLKTVRDENKDIIKAYAYQAVHLNGDNIVGGTGTNASQIWTVYVKKRQAGSGSAPVSGTMHDYIQYAADFYSDAACTQPYTLPTGLTLQYDETTTVTYNNGSPSSVSTFSHIVNAPSNVSSVALPAVWSYCEGGLVIARNSGITEKGQKEQGMQKTASVGGTTNGLPPGGGGGGEDDGYCSNSTLYLKNGSGYEVKAN